MLCLYVSYRWRFSNDSSCVTAEGWPTATFWSSLLQHWYPPHTRTHTYSVISILLDLPFQAHCNFISIIDGRHHPTYYTWIILYIPGFQDTKNREENIKRQRERDLKQGNNEGKDNNTQHARVSFVSLQIWVRMWAKPIRSTERAKKEKKKEVER